MAERAGVLVVSYGSRAASIVDALRRSENYKVKIFDADKQRNPFIVPASAAYEITGADIQKICDFAARYKNEIDFGIVGPENPIIDGVRDLIEEKTGIPMICPTRECAIEGSKVAQRVLMEEVVPEANPRFKVFDRKEYESLEEVRKDVFLWLDELDDEVAVKPDIPATGKGVGVWGDHFRNRKQLWEHFLSIYSSSSVIIEEKVEGEEFSLQFFSDGKHLVPTPCVRDYKRAYDCDIGPNTGGMGSYKDKGNKLPFMSQKDWRDALSLGAQIFKKMKGKGSNPGLRGVPMYMAYVCAADGLKIFEINSRPGDPEIINIMPILKEDFVDTCFRIIDGNLGRLETEEKATVVTYAVPMTYGECRRNFSGSTLVNLSGAYKLADVYGDRIRIYPGSMELRNGATYALKSRAVAVVGIAENIEDARNISLDGIRAIDGPLWNRWDIASIHHIKKSIVHMKELRGGK